MKTELLKHVAKLYHEAYKTKKLLIAMGYDDSIIYTSGKMAVCQSIIRKIKSLK